MPINPQDNDNAKSSEGDNLFYLLKTKDSIGAGNRDENGLADKFFGTEDLAILQNSVLSQQLRPLEFKPGQPGQIKQAWAQYLAVGSDSLVDTSQGFVKSEHTLSWETNFDGTEDQIVRAREKSWANAVNSAWLGFVQKWYIANDFVNVANGSFLFAENGIVVSPALGPDLVGGPIPDNFISFNTKFLDAFWADISNVLSGPAGGPTLGEDDILSYIQELSTTRSLAFGAGSESYSLFKSYYRYYDSETGELKPDVSFPGSILDAINELYAPTQDTALEMMSDDVTSLYSVYNSVKGDLNNLQNNLGQIVRGETIVTGYENVNTQVQVPSIPPGDDPADYKELTTVFDVFGDFRQAIQTEEYGIPTTIISGVRVNFELIKNKTLSGLMDTPSGNISGQILIANGSGFDYAPYALTGLLDTPVSYQRHSGDYLVVNDNESGIHFTGIEKIAADLADYGFGGNDSQNITGFTGLYDTPVNYQRHSGDYLVVNDNESSIHFTGIEKIASDLTDYGFLDGVGGGGGSSTSGAFESLPLRDTHPSTDSIPFAIPDAIIAKNNISNEMILSLEVITENSTDLANNRNLIYTAYKTDYSIYFQNDTNGSFKQSNNIQGTYQQNLKWFVDNDRALYYGGSGSSTTSYIDSVVTKTGNGPIDKRSTDTSASDTSYYRVPVESLRFDDLEVGATYRIHVSMRGYHGGGDLGCALEIFNRASSFSTDINLNVAEITNFNNNGGDPDDVIVVLASVGNDTTLYGESIFQTKIFEATGTHLDVLADSVSQNSFLKNIVIQLEKITVGSATTTFDALTDTPVDYVNHSGKYLVVTDGEDGIGFSGIEKIASDLTDYGFGGDGGSSTIPSYTDLPDVTENDGKIVALGCDLHFSCDGEWKPLVSIDRLPLSETEQALYPACVTTVGESLQYTDYLDTVLNENSSLILQASLNGQTTDQVLHEVCTFQSIDGQSSNTSSSEGWQNITSNYNFASCVSERNTASDTTFSQRTNAMSSGDQLKGIGAICEFNRDGTILAFGWVYREGGSNQSYIDLMSINYNDSKEFTGITHIAALRSNIASGLLWGRSTSINDDGSVVAVTDLGVTNTNGGHGAIFVYDINANTNTATEKQIIFLPLSNSDYIVDATAYNEIHGRTMNVKLSGDGKTLVAQFLHNKNATNPKSIFIYNYNESTQMFELHQTINGIGFQDIRLSKDGSTLVVKCGYHISSRMENNIHDAENNEQGYFHGLKIFERDSQNVWVEQSSLTYFDLGIQEAVQTEGVNWNLPIAWALGSIFDINRDGSAILFQLPDRLEENDSALYPSLTSQAFSNENTGLIGVITWNGENWNRLGSNLLFDNGNLGYYMDTFDTFLDQTTCQAHGSISDDGTFIMVASRNMDVNSDYEVNMNFLKWNGSEWIKTSQNIYRGNNPLGTNGYCMSKAKHPNADSIIAFHGSHTSTFAVHHFSEECSTNLVSGGTTSDNSTISSCGVVRIKDTGYKWGLFPRDTEITVQAFPSSSCTFDGWTGGNFADPSSTETTLTINNSTSITGNFSVI